MEIVPTDPLKMQAMIFPLTDVSNKVTLAPTIDPILAGDKCEQNAGTAAARAWVVSGLVDALASEVTPQSERAKIEIKSVLVR
jgi:hypothetical protein